MSKNLVELLLKSKKDIISTIEMVARSSVVPGFYGRYEIYLNKADEAIYVFTCDKDEQAEVNSNFHLLHTIKSHPVDGGESPEEIASAIENEIVYAEDTFERVLSHYMNESDDENTKTIFEFVYSNVRENPVYQKIKSLQPEGAHACEIAEDGNIHIMAHYPRATAKEIKDFSGDYNFYYYEREGKAAILLDGCKVEMAINPSYYTDERFSKLLQKDALLLHSYLIDSKLDEIVATNCVEIKGRALESLKKCLTLNSSATREQYDYWITNVLYAREFDDNVKRSIRIGKVRRIENC